jgi:hypothetical protein
VSRNMICLWIATAIGVAGCGGHRSDAQLVTHPAVSGKAASDTVTLGYPDGSTVLLHATSDGSPVCFSLDPLDVGREGRAVGLTVQLTRC